MYQKLCKTALLTVISVMSSLIFINPALADAAVEEKPEGNTLNFLGGATMAYKNISFDIPAAGVSFSPDLMMFNSSGTLSYGSFFATLNYDQTIKDDTQYGTGNSSLIIMNREDMDISFGYYIGKGFSTFIGYKDGTLTADVSGETTSGGGCPTVCPENPFVVEFRDKGPFVGVSYTAALEGSSLIFNLAYADMEGTVFFGKDGGLRTSGDTTGFSYSVAWNIPISDNTTFTSKVNLVRYDFKDTELGIPGEDFTFQQKFDVISFTLAHYF